MLVELKKPKLKDGKDQLRSYCNATGAPIAVWTNGDQISYYQRKDPNYFEDIPGLPDANQTLADILQIKFTLEDLIANDKLRKEKKSLKALIEEMEDEVLANAGVDVFEELFKLIFTKLYDEWYSGQGNRRNKRSLEFRNTGQTEAALKNKIQELFDSAKKKWEGVFSDDAKISLTPSHLSVCVSSLENVKLFNSNLDVIDEAFEYLINQSSKGEKGQFFTPRYVIDMCVKMLNPQEDEYMIDTAAGSSGFPVHTIFHVWKQILEDEGIAASHLFSLEDKPPRCREYVEEKVFAIDFDEKAVRVARTLNLIAGDGQTNVLHLNTLDYEMWDEVTQQEDWQDIYFEGFKRLKKRRPPKSQGYREFSFDVLMANPPFAGDIKEPRMIARYDLAKNTSGKWQSKVGRDILFIERNLDFLKPGGRMGIVLPQGRFNNSSDKNIRDYLAERCRILAVVGLHGNTFKPHTGTKTSVLFVQKWNDDPKVGALCPRKDDYNIFFATMRKSGKDNSGEKIWRRVYASTDSEDDESVLNPPSPVERRVGMEGDFLQDIHGHLVVNHDLYNHEGLTEDGIAEAFVEFAKKEKLSFFKSSPSVTTFDAERYERLMDGLEAVELSLSEALKENISFRVDSDFFKKQYLHEYHQREKFNNIILGDIAFITDGQHGYHEVDETSNISHITAKNTKNWFTDKIGADGLAQWVDDKNKRSSLKENDVLLANRGTVGYCSIVKNDILPANIDQDIARIALNTESPIFPEYLLTYLNSKIGYDWVIRNSSGMVQQGLPLNKVSIIAIPILNNKFQIRIKSLIDFSWNTRKVSKQLYQEAEDLLLSELNLKDWQPTEETIAVKSFAESYLVSNRFDAGHYKPKYDEVWEKLNALKPIKIICLEEILTTITNGQTPLHHNLSIGEVKFLTAEHIDDFKINYETAKRILLRHHQTELMRTHLFKGDILITIKGKIGNAAVVKNLDELVNINQDVALIRLVPNIHPYYVAGFVNSLIGKLLVEKACTGQINPFLSLGSLKKLTIPIFAAEYMQQLGNAIKLKVDAAHQAAYQSKQLLEIAKTRVERAIETDEATATDWINQQLETLGVEIK